MKQFVVRPLPKPYLTATDAVVIDECPYRYALDRDPRTKPLREPPTTHVAIGNAVHALAEAVSRGGMDDVPDAELRSALSAWWDTEIALQAAALQRQARFGIVPEPRQWPFYAKKRSAALRRALARVRSRRDDLSRAASSTAITVEKPLSCAAPPLQGKPDRVERHDEHVTVVDLKTGIPPEEGMSRAYRVQLFFYAALIAHTTGERVDSVAIEWIDGTREYLTVNPAEVETLLDSLLHQIAEVKDGDAHELRLSAKPSPEACRLCPYPAACDPYGEAPKDDWGFLPPVATGRVAAIEAVDEAAVITLSCESGQPVRIHGCPTAQTPTLGSTVSISGLHQLFGSTDLQCTWMTRCMRLEDAPTLD